MSMENALYLAVFGTGLAELPPQCRAAYGGFGFQSDGSVRIPYTPPKESVILFDDRVIPSQPNRAMLQDFLSELQMQTVIFDFEQPKNPILQKLIREINGVEVIIPTSYAGTTGPRVLARPYAPTQPFGAYLQTLRCRYHTVILELQPISCAVCCGRWSKHSIVTSDCGRFSKENQCMYAPQRTNSGLEICFYDTKKSILSRAAAACMPCLLPLTEYEALSE